MGAQTPLGCCCICQTAGQAPESDACTPESCARPSSKPMQGASTQWSRLSSLPPSDRASAVARNLCRAVCPSPLACTAGGPARLPAPHSGTPPGSLVAFGMSGQAAEPAVGPAEPEKRVRLIRVKRKRGAEAPEDLGELAGGSRDTAFQGRRPAAPGGGQAPPPPPPAACRQCVCRTAGLEALAPHPEQTSFHPSCFLLLQWWRRPASGPTRP